MAVSMYAVWRRFSRILEYVSTMVTITGLLAGMTGYRCVARPVYQLLMFFGRMPVGDAIRLIVVIEFVSRRKFRWSFQRPDEPAEV